MAAIRSKNSKAELTVRRGLHALGLRYRLGWSYRLNGKLLPGKPDLVFPAQRAVIFVNGCFWHGHGCHLFRWPRTEEQFWRQKIEANVVRDRAVREQLRAGGWRIGEVWECALKGSKQRSVAEVLGLCRSFVLGDEQLVIDADEHRQPLK